MDIFNVLSKSNTFYWIKSHMSIIQQKPMVSVALYDSQSSMAPSGKESKSFVTPPFDVLSSVGSVFYHDKLIGMLGKTQRVEK